MLNENVAVLSMAFFFIFAQHFPETGSIRESFPNLLCYRPGELKENG